MFSLFSQGFGELNAVEQGYFNYLLGKFLNTYTILKSRDKLLLTLLAKLCLVKSIKFSFVSAQFFTTFAKFDEPRQEKSW